jgi:hypothetical protein
MHFGRLEEPVSNITCGLSDPLEDTGIHDEVLGQALLGCDLQKMIKRSTLYHDLTDSNLT